MVLRLISCSPRRPGSFATVISGIASTDLTPASGCQDHTTSPSAFVPFVNGTISVHRIPSRVRDDREAPLEWNETAKVLRVIWVNRKQEYFLTRDWTTQITLIRFNKIAPRRRDYDAADLPVGQISVGWARSSPVIARSNATKQSSFLRRGTTAGLLRGACHRAAQSADPLARNDGDGPAGAAPRIKHHPPSGRGAGGVGEIALEGGSRRPALYQHHLDLSGGEARSA